MIRSRTIVVPDPLARANVIDVLGGPGAPLGVLACTASDATIVVSFDAERSAPELIDALIDMAARLVPTRTASPLDRTAALAAAARGLAEPDLTAHRIIETYLP